MTRILSIWLLTTLCSVAVSGCGSEDVDLTPPVLTLESVNGSIPPAAPDLTKIYNDKGTIPFTGIPFWGNVEAGAEVTATLNTTTAISPVTVSGTTWSALLAAPVQGANVIAVTANDRRGNLNNLYFTILFDSVAPTVTFDRFLTPATVPTQTIGGLVEAGATVTVASSVAATTCTPVTINNGAWSCPVSGLTGVNTTFTATATDSAGNGAAASRALQLNPGAALLTIDEIPPTKTNSVVLSGTLAAGHTVQVTAPTGVVVGSVDLTTPGVWQCPLSTLLLGNNQLQVTLMDATATAVVTAGTVVQYDPLPPQVTATVPAAGATLAVATSPVTAVTATFNERLDETADYTGALTLKDASAAPIAGVAAFDPATRLVTFTPTTVPLPPGTYTATLSNTIADLAGNLYFGSSWTFTVQ